MFIEIFHKGEKVARVPVDGNHDMKEFKFFLVHESKMNDKNFKGGRQKVLLSELQENERLFLKTKTRVNLIKHRNREEMFAVKPVGKKDQIIAPAKVVERVKGEYSNTTEMQKELIA